MIPFLSFAYRISSIKNTNRQTPFQTSNQNGRHHAPVWAST